MIGWLALFRQTAGGRSLRSLSLILAAALGTGQAAAAGFFQGHVVDAAGAPIVGAMVTFAAGQPERATTVFSDAAGHYRTPPLFAEGSYRERVRRIGWKDLAGGMEEVLGQGRGREVDFVLERETDPEAVAAQLPSNRWYGLLLERIDDPEMREELVRQCTFCHQQGNWATRAIRTPEEWQKVLSLMARMGAGLSAELRSQVPTLFSEAYDPKTAVSRLTEHMNGPEFAPAPPGAILHAVIDEWVVGHSASMQHDLMVHPNGRVYSVDMLQDKLYELDPVTGRRRSFSVPRGDLPLGGVFASTNAPVPSNSNAHVGPHSIQAAPDGTIWITLALGNQLARFDPVSESWSTFPLKEGFYPHTLRVDPRGRIWYTIAVSNHVGVYDPATKQHRWIRLPSPTIGQAVASRLLPIFLWLSRHVDVSSWIGAGEAPPGPVPYGIDVAPNGDIWFSQLNAQRIGRIDPETFEVEIVETPFTAPRRLRFDAQGRLWIPGFSSGLVSRFDPETREFRSWKLPIEPAGTETPYALNVHPRDGSIWICGTNSDSLIRFDPRSETFRVYPLPTRVTYTREIDFDSQGRVWASNSNLPAWQIEGALPRLIRLDPGGAPAQLANARPEATR